MKRRKFIKNSLLGLSAILFASKTEIINAANNIRLTVEDYKQKILDIIRSLKSEGSNLVNKVMDGKKYEFNPSHHYPKDGGIKDSNTGYQLFFHAHRENEYGHFHTFATDDEGELIHLLLISMNKSGELIGLATVNRWVTGDKYVDADKLKMLSSKFYIQPSLFKENRVIDFANTVFKAYPELINKLFDERDRSIKDYVNTNYREPFEDRSLEILSYRKIDLEMRN